MLIIDNCPLIAVIRLSVGCILLGQNADSDQTCALIDALRGRSIIVNHHVGSLKKTN